MITLIWNPLGYTSWRRQWHPTQYSCRKIPWTGEPGGLRSMGSHRVGHDWSDLAAAAAAQRRQWHPTPVLLPGKSHGWRSLVGCSPWGREESDTTDWLHFHFSLSCMGEGNGNPLQFLPGESQGLGSLVGCHLWGGTESDTTEAT